MQLRENHNLFSSRYPVDVQTAQMYYPFGMQMPGNIETANVGGTKTISPVKTSALHGVFHNIGLLVNRDKPGDIMFNLAGAIRDHIDQSHFQIVPKTILGLKNKKWKDYPHRYSQDGVVREVIDEPMKNNKYTNE